MAHGEEEAQIGARGAAAACVQAASARLNDEVEGGGKGKAGGSLKLMRGCRRGIDTSQGGNDSCMGSSLMRVMGRGGGKVTANEPSSTCRPSTMCPSLLPGAPSSDDGNQSRHVCV